MTQAALAGLLRPLPKPWIVHCPRCSQFTASDLTEGRVIQALCAHIAQVHWKEWSTQKRNGNSLAL